VMSPPSRTSLMSPPTPPHLTKNAEDPISFTPVGGVVSLTSSMILAQTQQACYQGQ
jgi:hypothetical protein